MSFNNIAIKIGGVAGMPLLWNASCNFQLNQFGRVSFLLGYLEAFRFQNIRPGRAATTTSTLDHVDRRSALRYGLDWMSHKQCKAASQKASTVKTCHVNFQSLKQAIISPLSQNAAQRH